MFQVGALVVGQQGKRVRFNMVEIDRVNHSLEHLDGCFPLAKTAQMRCHITAVDVLDYEHAPGAQPVETCPKRSDDMIRSMRPIVDNNIKRLFTKQLLNLRGI
ncbi:hypothetical protein WS57_21795 [Burkholderia pseudomultivorans]|nr:hypothetical protein WS57_21795 [Burkholderia pseudomultivorans]